MARAIYFEEEQQVGSELIPLGETLAIGRLDGTREQAQTGADAKGAAKLFLLTGDRSVQALDQSRCQLLLHKRNGEYWIEDRNPESNSCLLNNDRFTTRKLLMNDRISVGGGFHFRYDGDCLTRVPRTTGGRIKADHLMKYFDRWRAASENDRIYAVNDISLEIASNEFLGIVGPSGCGKSTLLSLLSGAQRPSAGKVLLNGFDLHENVELARAMIGVVPQDDIVHPELTVWEAVTTSAGLRLPSTVSRRIRTSLAEKVLSDLGLWERRMNRIEQLSGGQRKRASIAVEMLRESSVLILDEPSSGLDPDTEEKLMAQLRRLSEQGRTIICTTHVLDLAYLFDRICFIVDGKVVFVGPEEEALRFFGVSSLRAAYARLKEIKRVTDFDTVELQKSAAVKAALPEAEPGAPADEDFSMYDNGCIARVSALDAAQVAELKRWIMAGYRLLVEFRSRPPGGAAAYEGIFELWNCAKHRTGAFGVINGGPELDELIQANRVAGMLPAYPDRESALAEFGLGKSLAGAEPRAARASFLAAVMAALALAACIFVWWQLLR
jgi:ABC-type multidrug transport system ATPase subunit